MANQITTTVTCPECSSPFESVDSLSRHCGRTHKHLSSKQLFLKLNNLTTDPTCKCGCGEAVMFFNAVKGFGEYKRGHTQRIAGMNNWGNNPEVLEKSQAVRRKNWNDGTYTAWRTGLSNETDERVAAASKKASETILANKEEVKSRSERFKLNRSNGIVNDLSGSNHSQWKGGVSPLNQTCHSNKRLYDMWKYDKLKASEFKCSICASTKNLQVHHDKEAFSDIIRKIAKEHNWTEKLSTFSNKDEAPELFDLKIEISEAVADYHINNNVSGVVLCEECHKLEHANLNF